MQNRKQLSIPNFTNWIRFSIYVLLSLSTLVSVVNAKELPPKGGEPKPFVLPDSKSMVLSNGLQVTFLNYGNVPKVSVSIVVRAGGMQEGQHTWLSDLTGEMIKEGTQKRTAQELAIAAAAMGGGVGVSVGTDQTTIGSDALSEFAEPLLELLAEIVRQPLFPASELKRIKQDFSRSLSVAKTQPRSLASEAFVKLLYTDHAYGKMFPDSDQLNAYTLSDVQSFYQKHYSAGRTHIYVAGQFDLGRMRRTVKRLFADWDRGQPVEIDLPNPQAIHQMEIIDRPGAPQSTVYLGLPIIDPTHPDFIGLSVMNTLLGGFFSSRITSNLREDKGYTYSPRSVVSVRYRDAYWAQIADITFDKTGPALQEIVFEINRLKSEPPRLDELEAVQNFMAGKFILRAATPGGLIGNLNYIDLHGLPKNYLSTYLQKIRAITPQDVQQMAQRYLRLDQMVLVVVGDKHTLDGQIANLNLLQ